MLNATRRMAALTALTWLVLGVGTYGGTTYVVVDYPSLQNGYTVSGTITTTGATGTALPNTDITSWDIAISLNGVLQFSLTPSNSGVGPGSFDATPSILTVATPSDVAGFVGPGVNEIVWYGSSHPSAYVGAQNSSFLWFSAWDPSDPIASVPEPSTAVLASLGTLGVFAFIAYSRSRRCRGPRRQVAA